MPIPCILLWRIRSMSHSSVSSWEKWLFSHAARAPRGAKPWWKLLFLCLPVQSAKKGCRAYVPFFLIVIGRLRMPPLLLLLSITLSTPLCQFLIKDLRVHASYHKYKKSIRELCPVLAATGLPRGDNIAGLFEAPVTTLQGKLASLLLTSSFQISSYMASSAGSFGKRSFEPCLLLAESTYTKNRHGRRRWTWRTRSWWPGSFSSPLFVPLLAWLQFFPFLRVPAAAVSWLFQWVRIRLGFAADQLDLSLLGRPLFSPFLFKWLPCCHRPPLCASSSYRSLLPFLGPILTPPKLSLLGEMVPIHLPFGWFSNWICVWRPWAHPWDPLLANTTWASS